MFNDKYGLTKAVLEGRKTQTRRIISVNFYNRVDWKYFEEGHNDCIIDDDVSILDCGRYYVGEEVAIAQKYSDINEECKRLEMPVKCRFGGTNSNTSKQGWNNKMFVKAELMLHHIKITNVRVEKLQDISDEDCIAEGIEKGDFTNTWDTFFFREGQNYVTGRTAWIAYSKLIDKVCGRVTWNSNPWVFVYEFELID